MSVIANQTSYQRSETRSKSFMVYPNYVNKSHWKTDLINVDSPLPMYHIALLDIDSDYKKNLQEDFNIHFIFSLLDLINAENLTIFERKGMSERTISEICQELIRIGLLLRNPFDKNTSSNYNQPSYEG